MKQMLLALLGLMLVGCATRTLHVDSVTLSYREGKLERITIRAPVEDLRTIANEAAMYVQVWPCGQPVENTVSYHPVFADEVRVDRSPYLEFGVLEGKDTGLPDRLPTRCAQIVADGISFWRYRSNIVPVQISRS